MKRKIVLTFDLEFWHGGKFLRRYVPQNKNDFNDFIEESTIPVLDFLKKRNQRATFFVLGKAAEKYPAVIKRIFDEGHEIASHGYSHTPLDRLTPQAFREEIIRTDKIIRDITGQKPVIFRAPNFSLGPKTAWALEVLKQERFQCDSSLHPFCRRLRNQSPVTELPSSLGGIYFRALPLGLFLFLAKTLFKTKLPMIYLHPYELFASCPKVESAPWFKKKIKYFGTKTAWQKFEKLAARFDFISIKQYLDEKNTIA